MPKYEVISAIRTKGELHREGETVELDAEVGQSLEAMGRVAPVKAAAKQPAKADGKKDQGEPNKG